MEQWLKFLIVYYHLGLVQSLYITLKAGSLEAVDTHVLGVGHCFGGFGALCPDPCGHWSLRAHNFRPRTSCQSSLQLLDGRSHDYSPES